MGIYNRISRLTALLLFSPLALHAEEAPKSNFEKIKDGDLVYRVTLGKPAEVLRLLEGGANPNALNINAMPALSAAAERTDDDAPVIAQYLLDHGANINGIDSEGNTALDSAIKIQNEKMVWFLLSKGADFHIKNKKEQTPLDIAGVVGNQKIIELVKQAINIEQQRIADAKSENALKVTMRKHAYMNCANAYMRYYEITVNKREPKEVDKSAEFTERRKALEDYASAMQRQFSLEPEDVAYIAEASSDAIVNEMDEMVSNQNRKRLGFGQPGDMEDRCGKIADSWKLSVFDPHKRRQRYKRKDSK